MVGSAARSRAARRALFAVLLLLFSLRAGLAAATLPATVELRQIGDLMVPFQAGLPIPTYEPQGRPRIELADGWRMQRAALDSDLSLTARTPEAVLALEKEGKGVHRPEFDDEKWASALVPSVANPPPRSDPDGVWYRRRFNLPATWGTRRVLLHCLAANYIADVWVNGRYAGYHEGGFTPFTFDISKLVTPTGTNVVVIRVDNPPWRGTDASRQEALFPPGPGDWWNATGLLRDVYLEAVPEVSLVRADVRAEPTDEGAQLRVMAVLRNAGSEPFAGHLELSVFPTNVGEGNLTAPRAEAIVKEHQSVEMPAGEASYALSIAPNTVVAWSETLTTEELATWTPGAPHLYVLEATLHDEEGQLRDRVQTQFGVRSLVVDSKQPRLLLNGEPISLLGVGRMEDDPQLGRALSYRDGFRLLLDLRSAKWLGANFLRLRPGVPHPLTTLLTDRLGLVCWEEIPADWLSAEAMQRQWEDRHIGRQMFLEMLYQDYNRPSVGFWGVGHMLAAGGVHRDFVRDLADMGRFLDGTRLMGESAALDERSPNQTECDVLGYAFDVAQGASQDAMADALAVLDRRHRAQPGKPVIITEVGALAGADATAWDRQVVTAEAVLPALSARPYVAGVAWWTLFDYLSPEGIRATGIRSRDRRTTRQVNETLVDQFSFFQRRGE